MRKALSDEHGQHVMGLAKDLAGTHGLLSPTAARTANPTRAAGTTAICTRVR